MSNQNSFVHDKMVLSKTKYSYSRQNTIFALSKFLSCFEQNHTSTHYNSIIIIYHYFKLFICQSSGMQCVARMHLAAKRIYQTSKKHHKWQI